MPLQPGTALAPYELTAKIGDGGMGEVYRARDTKLDRDVALPETQRQTIPDAAFLPFAPGHSRTDPGSEVRLPRPWRNRKWWLR